MDKAPKWIVETSRLAGAQIYHAKKTAEMNCQPFKLSDVCRIIETIFYPAFSKHAPKPLKATEMPDADWLHSLKAEPAFAGVNIDVEFAKCVFWCKTKGKRLSRGRVRNWLMGAEREMDPGENAPRGLSAEDIRKQLHAVESNMSALRFNERYERIEPSDMPAEKRARYEALAQKRDYLKGLKAE